MRKGAKGRVFGPIFKDLLWGRDGWGGNRCQQVVFQLNANHPLVESIDYIKFEGM